MAGPDRLGALGVLTLDRDEGCVALVCGAEGIPGVDVQTALDAYVMVVSLEAYDVAVRERGWTPEAVEAWWHRVLATLLLR